MSGVHVVCRDRVLWITIDRPERRNALDRDTIGLLKDAIVASGTDDSRVVVLGGAGEAFCTGADLRAVRDSSAPPADEGLEILYNATISAIWNLPKPVIAAVGGTAAGYGCSLAFAADVRIASANARFALSFVRRGLALDGGASFFLPRLAGLRGMEMALRGNVFDAMRALQLGLVDHVFPAEEFARRVEETAAELAANAPLAIAEIKRAIHRTSTAELEETLAREMDVVRKLVRSEDFQEGLNSFLEKRTPVFRGR
jgi:2-(1,2-epoxy-1,2-dihydrophenyl)acetyl-CoA isomerase